MDSDSTCPKTRSERLQVVNETKIKLMEHGLETDPASKVLWMILDRYVETGTPVNTVLHFKGRQVMGRHYVVNLYNNRRKLDVVLIRTTDMGGQLGGQGPPIPPFPQLNKE